MGRIGATVKSNVSLNLKRLNGELQSSLVNHLRESAGEIAELAKLNVPALTESVEDSIIVKKPKKDGINNAFTFEVGVDVRRFRRAARQRKSGWSSNASDADYFKWLHESSEYKLGDKSKAKNRRVSGMPHARVGNKFLSRAYESLEPEINKRAEAIVQRIIARRN
jgi:hypothetical protein